MADGFVPLFAALLIILAAAVVRFRFDFMEPAVIFVATMTVSVTLAMFFAERWALTVGLKTFLCLTLAAVAFTLGNVFAERCWRATSTTPRGAIEIDEKKMRAALIVMAILLFFNFLESYEMSMALGNQGGVADMIRVNRQAIEAQTASFSRWTNYRSMIAQAITCTFLYAFIHNFIFRGALVIRYLAPLIFYVPILILNTGRMGLLCLVVYSIVVASILRLQRSDGISDRLSIAKSLIGAGIIFAALFMLMGVFTGKTVSAERTPLVILAHYAGLSIPALDVFLDQNFVESTAIGSYTLHGIYRALGTLGFDLPTVPLFLPFVKFFGIDTNVYTAEARYIHDYGWCGMLLILWSFGAIYSFAYRFVRARAAALPLMYYGFCAYPLFLSSIDERVMLDFFSTTPIYILILFFVSTKIFLKR